VEAVGNCRGHLCPSAQPVRLAYGAQLIPRLRHQEFLMVLHVFRAKCSGDATARIEIELAQPIIGGGDLGRTNVGATINRRSDG